MIGAVSMLLSAAYATTYCTTVDCRDVPDEQIAYAESRCLYESRITMHLIHWKQINRFRQTRRVPSGTEIICMDKIPLKYRSFEETSEQTKFLDRMLCHVHDLTQNAILASIDYYERCFLDMMEKNYVPREKR